MRILKCFVSLLMLVGCSSPQVQRMTASEESPTSHSMSGPPERTDQQITEACNSAGWTDLPTEAQQQVINSVFAVRDHRVRHSLWHAIRSGLSSNELGEVVNTYGAGWNETHPLCPPPENNANSPSDYNPVGEDFLFMHHQMVRTLRENLLARGIPCIAPWTSIPDPKIAENIPPGVIQGPKTNAAFAMLVSWDKWIQNADNLRKISLSQLGWALEFTIHNNLHMRFAEDRPPLPYRAADPNNDGAQVPLDGNFPADWKFDEAGYNWLADPYGAAVNPRFWKIHGYVDHILEAWLQANGKARLAQDCGDDNSCYQWRGTWVGDHSGLAHHMSATHRNISSTDDDDFNQRRLAHQRLGVIKNLPAPAGPRALGPPPDLLKVAAQTVCSAATP